jgi:hypothetical protein
LLSVEHDKPHNNSEKNTRVQFKAILGIFHKRSSECVDVEYHKQYEKAKKFDKSRMRLK